MKESVIFVYRLPESGAETAGRRTARESLTT